MILERVLRLLLSGAVVLAGGWLTGFAGGNHGLHGGVAHAGEVIAVKRIIPADDFRIRRNYRHMSNLHQSGLAVLLEGTSAQIARLAGWLDEISSTSIGRETLEAIYRSGNTVTIRHSEWALVASGRTLAPVSAKLIDGRGDDATILFDARIPDSGSHIVYDSARNPIGFSAVQNLFHELSHARHMSNGTWRYFDSEGQAIEEENRFRQQYARTQGHSGDGIPLRVGKRGEQIWEPCSEDLYGFNFSRRYALSFEERK